MTSEDGEMLRITPDLEVWLVSDPVLASHWRDLARHLSLSSSIPRWGPALEAVEDVLSLTSCCCYQAGGDHPAETEEGE